MSSTINIIINNSKKMTNYSFKMGTFSYDSLKIWLLPAVHTTSKMTDTGLSWFGSQYLNRSHEHALMPAGGGYFASNV